MEKIRKNVKKFSSILSLWWMLLCLFLIRFWGTIKQIRIGYIVLKVLSVHWSQTEVVGKPQASSSSSFFSYFFPESKFPIIYFLCQPIHNNNDSISFLFHIIFRILSCAVYNIFLYLIYKLFTLCIMIEITK